MTKILVVEWEKKTKTNNNESVTKISLTIGLLEGGVAYLMIVLYDTDVASLTVSLRETWPI